MKTLLLGLTLQALLGSPTAPDEAALATERAAAPRLAQLGPGAPGVEEPREAAPGEGFSPAQLEQLRRMVARLMQAERREPPRGPEPRPGQRGPEREVHYHYHYYHPGQHEEHHAEHHDSHRSVHYHYHYHYN